MTRRFSFLAGLVALCLICLFAQKAKAEIIERIAAVVNDDIIMLSEVKAAAESWQKMLVGIRDPQKRMAKKREVYKKVLNGLIEDRLMEQQMNEMAFEIGEEEVQGAIERVMKENRIPDETALRRALLQQGITWNDYLAQVRKQLRKWKFINAKVGHKVKVADAEIRRAYEKERQTKTRDYEFRAAHILFRLDENASEEAIDAKREKAAEVLQRLKTGADFTETAKAFSEGPTAKYGGDLGYFQKGVMIREFEDATVRLEVGEISGVVRTGFGFHIIKLLDRRPLPLEPYEKAAGRIRNELREAAMQREMKTWINELRDKAYIRIMLDEPAVRLPNIKSEPAQ